MERSRLSPVDLRSAYPRLAAAFGFALIFGIAPAGMVAGCAFGSDADATENREASTKPGTESKTEVGFEGRKENETSDSSRGRSYRLLPGSHISGEPLDHGSSDVRIRYDAPTRTYTLVEPKSFSAGRKHRECHPHGCEYFDDRWTVYLDELRFTVEGSGTLHGSLLSGTTTMHRSPLDSVSIDTLEGSVTNDELDLTLRDSKGSHRLILRPDRG